jgi:hypothetical protein
VIRAAQNAPMQPTERELRAMTHDLDAMHGDLFPRFRTALAEITEGRRDEVERERSIARMRTTRRTFLRGGLATAGLAGRGALGAVPPAIATFVTTAKMQHSDHANAWNSALVGAGQQPQTAPDPHYTRIVQQALPGVKTVVDAARLALTVETVAVETYSAGSALVTDRKNRQVALSIAPVEAQHVAILHYVLGQYPVPDSFVKTDMAASPSDLSESR